MAKHEIYFAHGGEQRVGPPPLELVLYQMDSDDPDEVKEAGRKYGRWLIQNASGNWTQGMRQAFDEMKTMRPEEEE